MADDPMWLVVMFDLPVQTKKQRKTASSFRKLLLDVGFSMVQLSVYAKYKPTGSSGISAIRKVKANIPKGGMVRLLEVTDKQWTTMLRFSGGDVDDDPETPQQLTIF